MINTAYYCERLRNSFVVSRFFWSIISFSYNGKSNWTQPSSYFGCWFGVWDFENFSRRRWENENETNSFSSLLLSPSSLDLALATLDEKIVGKWRRYMKFKQSCYMAYVSEGFVPLDFHKRILTHVSSFFHFHKCRPSYLTQVIHFSDLFRSGMATVFRLRRYFS